MSSVYLNDAVNEKNLLKIVIFVHDCQTSQNTNTQQSPHKELLDGLALAAQRNYAHGMAALFDPQRAAYVIKNTTPHNDQHRAGLEFLQNLIDMFETDFNNANTTYNQFMIGLDRFISPKQIKTTMEEIVQNCTIYAQHKRISHEVQTHTTKSASKKM